MDNVILIFQRPCDARKAFHVQIHTVPFSCYDSCTIGYGHFRVEREAVCRSRTVATGAPIGRAIWEDGRGVPSSECARQGNDMRKYLEIKMITSSTHLVTSNYFGISISKNTFNPTMLRILPNILYVCLNISYCRSNCQRRFLGRNII